MAKDDDKTLRLEPKTSAQKPETEEAVDDGLMEVSKDGETLRVHPTALQEHRKLGWN